MSIQPTMSQIIATVATGVGVTSTDLKYGRYLGGFTLAGEIAAYLAFTLTDLPACEVAAALGACQETDVLKAHDDVQKRCPADRSFFELLKNLSITALAEAKALHDLGIPPLPEIDPVALAVEVSAGRMRPTDLSTREILAIASGLASLSRDAMHHKGASNEH
ncbi:hypothetical protein [Labrys neptuniae]|uniref:Uncharacterized protein n=1 Tax=Labrys neptuniae TaxID=376174 RepID=A0ABV3PGK5_9HYPH